MKDGEREDQSEPAVSSAMPSLSVRQASFAKSDVEAFVRLARTCASERGGTFDEDVARFTFNGTPRGDPTINLLFSRRDAIGFAILRLSRQPFTTEHLAREEVLFILPEHRSLDSELLLHAASLAIFDVWGATVRELLVTASPCATEVSHHLAGAGHQPAALTTKRICKLIGLGEEQTLN